MSRFKSRGEGRTSGMPMWLLAGCLSTAGACSRSPITVDVEYDYGYVQAGFAKSVNLSFINPTFLRLTLRSAEASCGSITLRNVSSNIAPSQRGSVTVDVLSSALVQRADMARLEYGAPGADAAELVINLKTTCTVVPIPRFVPSALEVGDKDRTVELEWIEPPYQAKDPIFDVSDASWAIGAVKLTVLETHRLWRLTLQRVPESECRRPVSVRATLGDGPQKDWMGTATLLPHTVDSSLAVSPANVLCRGEGTITLLLTTAGESAIEVSATPEGLLRAEANRTMGCVSVSVLCRIEEFVLGRVVIARSDGVSRIVNIGVLP